MLYGVLVCQAYMIFKNRQKLEESCTLHLLPVESEDLDKVDELTQAVLKIFLGEKLLSDGLVDVILEHNQIFGRRIGHLFHEVGQLGEVEASDIIRVLSHGLENVFDHY
jgi:hypothetical protein